MWSPADKDPLAPSWFWGLARDYFILGMGVMGLQGEHLTRYRKFVDAWGDSLQDSLDQAGDDGATISDWGPDPLKRVPKPYDPDHPHGDLLKRKALAVSVPMSDDWRDKGLVSATVARIETLMPVWSVFDKHL